MREAMNDGDGGIKVGDDLIKTIKFTDDQKSQLTATNYYKTIGRTKSGVIQLRK